MTPGTEALFAALRTQVRLRKAQLARECGALLAVAAAAFVAYALRPDGRLAGLASVTLAGAVITWSWLRLSGDQSRALTRLRARLGDVVWVYVRIGAQNAREASLAFGLSDGQTIGVPAQPSAADRLLSDASLVFPCATIGFSAQAHAAFGRAPASLLGAPRKVPVGPSAVTSDTAWLAEPGRATLRPARFVGALGLGLVGLGLVGASVVLAAAAPGGTRAVLVALFGLAATAGLGLAAWGYRRYEDSPLYRALALGEGLASVQLVDGPTPGGRIVPMAVVTLRSGARYTFATGAPPAAP